MLLGAASPIRHVSVSTENEQSAWRGAKIEEWFGIRAPDRGTECRHVQKYECERDGREALNRLGWAEHLWEQAAPHEDHDLALSVARDQRFVAPRRSANEGDGAWMAAGTEPCAEDALRTADKGRARIDHSYGPLDRSLIHPRRVEVARVEEHRVRNACAEEGLQIKTCGRIVQRSAVGTRRVPDEAEEEILCDASLSSERLWQFVQCKTQLRERYRQVIVRQESSVKKGRPERRRRAQGLTMGQSSQHLQQRAD